MSQQPVAQDSSGVDAEIDNILNWYYLGDEDRYTKEAWNAHQAQARSQIKGLITRAREIYIPVRGFEGLYEVSNFGNIRSLPRGRTAGCVLKQALRGRGYLCVTLSKNNASKSVNVHRVVAENFISNPENKRTVNHRDGNPANNTVTNLEWATHSENEQHAYTTLGKVNPNKGNLKTHCKNGHELNEETTIYVAKVGWRYCRACHSARAKKYRDKVKTLKEGNSDV